MWLPRPVGVGTELSHQDRVRKDLGLLQAEKLPEMQPDASYAMLVF